MIRCTGWLAVAAERVFSRQAGITGLNLKNAHCGSCDAMSWNRLRTSESSALGKFARCTITM